MGVMNEWSQLNLDVHYHNLTFQTGLWSLLVLTQFVSQIQTGHSYTEINSGTVLTLLSHS